MDVKPTMSIDPGIFQLYGEVKVACVVVENIVVPSTPPRIKKIARSLEADLRQRFSRVTLAEEPIIKDWLALAARMGLKGDSVPAQVALIQRILDGRDIPKINAVVDIGNICAARFMSPVGMFDLDAITPPISLRLARNGDAIQYIGAHESTPIPTNEIVYADSSRVFSRYCRDSDETKITATTRRLFCVVDGSNGVPVHLVEEARSYLLSLLTDAVGQGFHSVMGTTIAA